VSPRLPEPPAGDEGPALVRPYALVRGRTRTADAVVLPVEAIVETIADGAGARLPREQGAIVDRCVEPCSVAELSVHLHVPVGVTRVLVGDLIEAGAVRVHLPTSVHAPDGTVDRALLERVLAGLEAL
jgi:hypothetical protein